MLLYEGQTVAARQCQDRESPRPASLLLQAGPVHTFSFLPPLNVDKPRRQNPMPHRIITSARVAWPRDGLALVFRMSALHLQQQRAGEENERSNLQW